MTLGQLEKLLELLLRGRSNEEKKLTDEFSLERDNPAKIEYLRVSIREYNEMIEKIMTDIQQMYNAV